MKESFGAVFDESGAYRYRLWRRWDLGLPSVCFLMLNPSTADATNNDPTISRCINMAKSWGFGAAEVVNLFAFRSTRQRDLWHAEDPVGPQNDAYIKRAIAKCDVCVVAWGNLPPAQIPRSLHVSSMLAGKKTYCLGLTKQIQPRHPLYLSSDVQMEVYEIKLPPAPKSSQ